MLIAEVLIEGMLIEDVLIGEGLIVVLLIGVDWMFVVFDKKVDRKKTK